jgi:DNA-binding response OmpR family regulator
MALPRYADPDLPTPRGAPSILVIDDDEYVHSALQAALRTMRPRLYQARSAEEGRRLAVQHRPQLAIIDVGLPDQDGYALAAALRADPSLPGMRILILTGHVPNRAKAEVAGVDGIIGKPFRLHTFLEAVREQLPSR